MGARHPIGYNLPPFSALRMHPSAPPNANPATPQQLCAIDATVERLKDLPGALLPILHAIQDEIGFVPMDGLDRIANGLNLSRAEVYGVLTFYHDFRTTKPGASIVKFCRAEACQANGCRSLEAHLKDRHGLAMGDTSKDGAVTLQAVYCLGNCALGPSMLVDGELIARATTATIDSVVAAAKKKTNGARA